MDKWAGWFRNGLTHLDVRIFAGVSWFSSSCPLQQASSSVLKWWSQGSKLRKGDKSQCTLAFQTSASFVFAAIRLAKASHMANSSIHVGKDYLRAWIQGGELQWPYYKKSTIHPDARHIKIWKKRTCENTQNKVRVVDVNDLLW